MSRGTRAVGASLLAIASLLLALCVIELGLRAIGFSERVQRLRVGAWQWTRNDPVLTYGNVPGTEIPEMGIRIDSRGFRGPEVAVPKPPGVVRVVCLGDSVTFGIWLEAPLTVLADMPYPAELERLARADGRAVEVVNAGILGQTTSGGLLQMLVQVLPLEPDVITVRFGNNDHGLGPPGAVRPLAIRWEYPVVRALPRWAWRLEIVRLIFHVYHDLVARHQQAVFLQRVPPDQFRTNLERFVEITRTEHIHLAFVDFPYREKARGLSPGEELPNAMQAARTIDELFDVHDQYQAIIAGVAAETHTPFVRTLDALRAAPEPTFSDWDLSHPNRAGSTIVARRLYEDLSALGWLGPSR